MKDKIKVGLVGVTGYTGMELVRLLHNHSGFELAMVTSRKECGKKLQDIYPFTRGTSAGDIVISDPSPDSLALGCKLVFLAVPHGTAMQIAASLLERKVLVVDLSADFRIEDRQVYEQWYSVPHTQSHFLREAVYGLPELNAMAISRARLVANPGCYPTSAILGLFPALHRRIVKSEGIVIDSKSGTTGAGRKAALALNFCEVHDSFRAYNLGGHRHTPEIEQELSKAVWSDIKVSFNTHLLPIDRGILSTSYALLDKQTDIDAVYQDYLDFYADSPWVRVLPPGTLPETRWVRGSMFCDIGLVVDPRTDRLIVVSCIDNLCRGASGQALANANLMCALPVDLGLTLAPLMP